ncbi:fibronectin type III domain-containing protein [Algibacter miyuki]|uniref:Fibronectin type III domain-containing protein n=1 Tax=Algibacter miyuki TaxID=1306933 RepID=A0ABV5GZE1_9FLAO|nr:fibronectin type III domain-containing protein [Algibacter miyuki]MDN3666796.1 fibronectin type III domain-containing protein [Algibacter miyuki]
MSLVLAVCILQTASMYAQKIEYINVDTTNGHAIKNGASGFNVRIADKVWSYTHPDFVASVKELKPGWLRYFSGTMGDAFSSATGQYDLDYIAMFDHQKPFLKGHRFVEVKGPHRITDLYHLLSEINGKLVVTINAFSETPEMVTELARFCKNNNIKVETWQFCNEPYFYVPNRNRYWWNDGYDYAAKMQPYAEAIQHVLPDAKLALNYTWDGVWTFMKEINKFQKTNGAYWNTFSKHSYAPHTGKKETLDQAYKRANTKLLEATSPAAMSEIEDYTWKDVPMIITEFGVWNSPLNGIYSGIYNVEYIMRQLQHTNTTYVAAHEVSNKFVPLVNKNNLLEAAFKNNQQIDTDTIVTGIHRDIEGKTLKIYHEATNNSNFLYKTDISKMVQVPGLKNTTANGMFVQTYKGNNGFNYLVITNRSGESNQFQVKVNGESLNETLYTSYIAADVLKTRNPDIQETEFKNGLITVRPFSVSVSKWKTNSSALTKPTIYKASIEQSGVKLQWGSVSMATSYKVFYGTEASSLDQSVVVKNKNEVLIEDVQFGKSYYFKIQALNDAIESPISELVSVSFSKPEKPEIFKVSRRDDTVTLFWKSVANAKGYTINYRNENGKQVSIDADNVFGYRLEGFKDETDYQFTVSAYNGLGSGEASDKENVRVSSKVPYSPRNISAIKQSENTIEVKWHSQENVSKETSYNVYRGDKLHEFTKIATAVKDTIFVDRNISNGKQYYYTVKGLTDAGESNFYPNIATAFSAESNGKITIQVVETKEDGYLVKVKLNKIQISSKDAIGIIINNVSYLNVEDIKIEGTRRPDENKQFQAFIPLSKVKTNSNYTIKAFITTQGKTLESALVNQYITSK